MSNNIENNEMYKKILDQVSEGIYFVDKDRKITYWNQSAEKISGYTEKEMKGSFCYNDFLNHIDEKGNKLCNSNCPLANTIEDGQSRNALVYLHHKQGQRIPVNVNIDPIYNDNNEIIGAVEVFKDESYQLEIQKRIETLEKQVYVDSLTNIPNRAFLQQALETMFARFNRYGTKFGIILYDIDHFKKVNDDYGHNVGDRVLKVVANTLYSNTRTSDHMGRWGGEEFMCIAPHANHEELLIIADRFRILVENSDLILSDQTINVTISAGCAIAQYDDSLNEIINRADVNLYLSKERGRNQITIGAEN